jgi:hypothetical protein
LSFNEIKTIDIEKITYPLIISLIEGTGYEYDGKIFVAWVLQVRRAEVVTK